MANVTLSANEVKRQAGRLRVQLERYLSEVNKIIMNLEDIENIIAVNQANTICLIDGSSNKLKMEIQILKANYENVTKSKLSTVYTHIADIMDEWANKSILNEEETSSNVSNTLSDLEFIKNLLALVK